jgi:membrane protease YdiL (CAAX protease family)
LGAFLRTLSPRAEFAIVTFGAFGYFIFGSVLSLLFRLPYQPITETDLHFLLLYELPVLILLSTFLYVRGWTLQILGFRPTIADPFFGVGLAAVGYLLGALIFILAHGIGLYSTSTPGQTPSNLSVLTVVAVSIVNPVFEEAFLCGYVICAVGKRRDLLTAINASVAIRLLCHLYQGPAAAIDIVPIGLVFAYWYGRTGRLWPVVFAHGLLDLTALLAFSVR